MCTQKSSKLNTGKILGPAEHQTRAIPLNATSNRRGLSEICSIFVGAPSEHCQLTARIDGIDRDDLLRFSRRCDWYLIRYTLAPPCKHFRPISDLPTLFRGCFMFLTIFRCFIEFLFEFRHPPFMFPTILSFFRRFATAFTPRYHSILHPITDDRVLLFPSFGLFSVWFRACPEPL